MSLNLFSWMTWYFLICYTLKEHKGRKKTPADFTELIWSLYWIVKCGLYPGTVSEYCRAPGIMLQLSASHCLRK